MVALLEFIFFCWLIEDLLLLVFCCFFGLFVFFDFVAFVITFEKSLFCSFNLSLFSYFFWDLFIFFPSVHIVIPKFVDTATTDHFYNVSNDSRTICGTFDKVFSQNDLCTDGDV